jgi:flagellin-specific chaperone FliS|tara:strand:- start:301 stop:462 length:162 start_codon:yes stop_codon:yes gene_type:complete
MNKYLIILGLEKLLEQVKDSKDLMFKSDYNKRVKEITEQIKFIKELKVHNKKN